MGFLRHQNDSCTHNHITLSQDYFIEFQVCWYEPFMTFENLRVLLPEMTFLFFFSFSFFFCSFPSHHRALSSVASSFFPASKLDSFASLILSLSSFQIYCHSLNLSLLYNMKNISIYTDSV